MTSENQSTSGAEAELVSDDELILEAGDLAEPAALGALDDVDGAGEVVQSGDLLAGRYRVERVIGAAGLGIAVNVRHPVTAEGVVLTYLSRRACTRPELVDRFVRAARLALKLKGEHIARVTDVGRLENGAPYAVAEHIDGNSLAEILRIRGPLPVDEAVDFVLQACEGLAEVHAFGLAHRRLSPAGLVLTRRPDGSQLVKVLDCALSDGLDPYRADHAMVTLLRTDRGTLRYTAPEQIREADGVDGRADVWALGLILIELLSGEPAYEAPSATALLAAIVADEFEPLRSLRPDAPQALEVVVAKATAKDPLERFATLADFAGALEPFARPTMSSSVERVSRTLRPRAAAPRSTTLQRPSLGQPRRAALPASSLPPTSMSSLAAPAPENRLPMLVSIAALTVGAIVVVTWGSGRDSQPEPPAAAVQPPPAAENPAADNKATPAPHEKTEAKAKPDSDPEQDETDSAKPADADETKSDAKATKSAERDAQRSAPPAAKRAPAPTPARPTAVTKTPVATERPPTTSKPAAAPTPKALKSAPPAAAKTTEQSQDSLAARGADLFDDAR